MRSGPRKNASEQGNWREENRPYIHLRNCCIARRLIRNIVKVVWTRKEYNHWETEGLIWKKISEMFESSMKKSLQSWYLEGLSLRQTC